MSPHLGKNVGLNFDLVYKASEMNPKFVMIGNALRENIGLIFQYFAHLSDYELPRVQHCHSLLSVNFLILFISLFFLLVVGLNNLVLRYSCHFYFKKKS